MSNPIQLSTKAAITLGLTAAMSLPIGATSYLNYANERDTQIRSTTNTLKAHALTESKRIDEWFGEIRRAQEQAARSSGVQSMDPALALPELKALQSTHPWAYSAALAGMDGKQIVRTDSAKLLDLNDRDYYKNSRKGEFAYQISVSKATNQLSLLSSVPVRGEDGLVKGVLSLPTNINDLNDKVVNRIGSDGSTWVILADGSPMKNPDDITDAKQHPAYVNAPAPGEQTSLLEVDTKRGPAFAVASRSQQGLIVVAQVPQAEELASLEKVKYNALIGLSGVLMLALAASFLLSNKIAGFVKRVGDLCAKAAEGHIDDSEFESLANSTSVEGRRLVFALHSVAVTAKQALGMTKGGADAASSKAVGVGATRINHRPAAK